MLKTTKKIFQLFAFSLAALVLSSQAFAASYNNMSFMANYQTNHATAINVFLPFLEKVKQDLDITFNYFGNNVLYPESESYAVFSDGRVDFGVVRGGLFAGVINYINVIEIPGILPNGIIGTLVGAEILKEFPQADAEFPADSVQFMLWAAPPYQIHTATPVKTLEELKGKKIIVWDAATRDIVLKLGANPIRLPPTDSYLSLSKGMADGVMAPIAPMRAFKIAEVAHHHLILNLSVGNFNMRAYKPIWDEIPADMQEYLLREGGEHLGLEAAKDLHVQAIADIEWMKGLGHEFYYLDEAQSEELAKLLAPAQQEWLDSVPDKVLGQQVLDFAKERIAYHVNEYEKGTYGDYK